MKFKLTFYLICVIFVALATEEVKMNTTNKSKDNSASIEIIDRNIVSQNNIIDDCYIIVGDSRTVEMNNYYNIDKNKNYYVIASNKGDYDYLINSAMPKIEEIAQKKKEYNINVIMCLGINDLARLDKYIDTYKNISSKYNLTIVSVNPIGYANGITNATIEMFNTNIKNLFTFNDKWVYHSRWYSLYKRNIRRHIKYNQSV